MGIVAGNEAFCDLKIAYAQIRYEYSSTSLATASIAPSYSYGTGADEKVDEPLVGFKAAATQGIVNNLPQWMAIRRIQNSRGWKLVNAWGQNLDEVTNDVSRTVADMFLETTDPSKRSRIYYTDLSRPEIIADRVFPNLLYNTSFSIRDVSRSRLPAGWTDHYRPTAQRAVLDDFLSLIGTNSVMMDDAATLSQVLEVDIPVDQMCGSVYVRGGSTTLSIVVQIESIHGVTYSSEKKLTCTNEWQRLYTSVLVNDQATRIQIVFKNTGPGTAWLSAPQLEQGGIPTRWTRSLSDSLPFLAGDSRLGLVQVYGTGKIQNKTTVFPVAISDDLITVNIPTRIERRNSPPKDLLPSSTSVAGRRVDYHNSVDSTEWAVRSSKVEERSVRTEHDIYQKYDIRDLRVFSDGIYGTRTADPLVIRTPLASAVRTGVLFVACKEEFRSNDYYVLKVIRPRTAVNDKTYLESLIDFDLKLPFSTTYGIGSPPETVSSIGFSEVDSSWLAVNTTAGRRFYYKLFFDYYYFELQTNRLYTLENYSSEGAALQVT